MAKRARTTLGPCTYCGEVRELTRDHVPPKGLFSRPRPSNLITVPACVECNRGASKDEEYCRLTLSLRAETANNPAAQRVSTEAVRSLFRGNNVGFLTSFASTLREVVVRTPQGLILGTAGTYEMDYGRVHRVLAKTIRGLYRHDFGCCLPANIAVVVSLDPDGAAPGASSLVAELLQRPLKTIATNTFAYRCKPVKLIPFGSTWLLTLYESLQCLATTLPKDFLAE
jgi:hypothetical protein